MPITSGDAPVLLPLTLPPSTVPRALRPWTRSSALSKSQSRFPSAFWCSIWDAERRFHREKFEAAMTSIEHLRAFAKPLGVRILLENIPNELSTPDRLVELIHAAHFDDVGVCFDFGHAHMMSESPSL